MINPVKKMSINLLKKIYRYEITNISIKDMFKKTSKQ